MKFSGFSNHSKEERAYDSFRSTDGVESLVVGIGFPSALAEVDVGTLKKGVVKITAKFSNTQKVGRGFLLAQGKKHLFIVMASYVIEGKTDCVRINKRKCIGKTIRWEKG